VADGLAKLGRFGGGLMNWLSRLAPLILVVAGSAQETVGQARAQYAPYPTESNEITPEHGGGGYPRVLPGTDRRTRGAVHFLSFGSFS
jgi:hypothetical protein